MKYTVGVQHTILRGGVLCVDFGQFDAFLRRNWIFTCGCVLFAWILGQFSQECFFVFVYKCFGPLPFVFPFFLNNRRPGKALGTAESRSVAVRRPTTDERSLERNRNNEQNASVGSHWRAGVDAGADHRSVVHQSCRSSKSLALITRSQVSKRWLVFFAA